MLIKSGAAQVLQRTIEEPHSQSQLQPGHSPFKIREDLSCDRLSTDTSLPHDTRSISLLKVDPWSDTHAIILRLSSPKLTYLLTLAVTVTRRHLPPASLACDILLENGVVLLKERRDVMPEGGGKLSGAVGHCGTQEGPVGLLGGVVFLPCWFCLIG